MLPHHKELDGLRGIAILLVIMMHCRFIAVPATLAQSGVFQLISIGWVGVDLFFALSGFLITRILLTTRQHENYFSNFYARRALRIFPLYYGFLAIAYFIAHSENAPEGFQQSSALAEASYFVHLQNWIPFLDVLPAPILVVFWSLAVEEQFYLVWPLIVLLMGRSPHFGKVCIALWFVTIFARSSYINAGHSGAYYLTFCRLDGLLLGAYVAVLQIRHGSLQQFQDAALKITISAGAAIILLRAINGEFHATNVLVLHFGMPLLALLFASLIVLAITAHAEGRLRKGLRNEWLCFFGKISFGMYVFHMLFVTFYTYLDFLPDNFWLAEVIFLPLVLVSTVILAWLSYKYFESPFLRRKPALNSVTGKAKYSDS